MRARGLARARARRSCTASRASCSACCATCSRDDVASIRLDSEKEYQRTLDLVEPAPARARAARAPARRPQNILEEHGVSTELERALRSKVWLESGGYIVINQTEALVAIDVNTGRYTGKKDAGGDDPQDEPGGGARRSCARSACATWAASSCVDFIDMEERKSRQKVMAALEQELRRDRSPSKVLSVNEFGLVILTRKRVRQSLERTALPALPLLHGQRHDQERGHRLLGDLRRGAQAGRRTCAASRLLLRVNPEVARALAGEEAGVLRGPGRAGGRSEITVQGDPLLHQEQFDVVPR